MHTGPVKWVLDVWSGSDGKSNATCRERFCLVTLAALYHHCHPTAQHHPLKKSYSGITSGLSSVIFMHPVFVKACLSSVLLRTLCGEVFSLVLVSAFLRTCSVYYMAGVRRRTARRERETTEPALPHTCPTPGLCSSSTWDNTCQSYQALLSALIGGQL